MKLTCSLGAALIVAGCASQSSPEQGSATEGRPPAAPAMTAQQTKVDKAALIAAAIQANPDNADQIFRQNGMTEQQFENLLYEIAADPEMSAAYNAKLRP